MMVGIGVVGCGSIARTRHIPEYLANSQADLVGVFDAVSDRAQCVAKEYNLRSYERFEDLLADPKIQAVSICTSNRFHAEMTIAALNAGKHVLCEKPMATSLVDAQKMIDAAQNAGRYLMIGHNQRFNRFHIRAKELLKKGVIGQPLTFKTFFMHKGPEFWSIDRSKNTWFFDKSAAFLGVMCDLGIHKIDLLRWLLDDEFCEVSAMLDTRDKRDSAGKLIPVEDNAMCLLRMRSEIMGMLGVSWTCCFGEENATVIYGTEGVMRLNDDPRYSIVIQRPDGEQLFFACGEMQTNDHQTGSGVIDHFVHSVVTASPPEISGEEGLAALKTVLACVRSSEEKRSIILN